MPSRAAAEPAATFSAPQAPALTATGQPALALTATAALAGPSTAPAAMQPRKKTSRLESILAELLAARRAGDSERLAALGGSPHIDLAANTVRVILEMDRDPEAHQAGPPVIEEVTLENGQKARIEHAPPIAIRGDLAQSIAATGATYETAYENLVQVLAPFDSLEALAQIPDVRLVRLPYPAGQQ